jgi:hypothetical protein
MGKRNILNLDRKISTLDSKTWWFDIKSRDILVVQISNMKILTIMGIVIDSK